MITTTLSSNRSNGPRVGIQSELPGSHHYESVSDLRQSIEVEDVLKRD